MAKLIHLNGAPGVGKSSIARRYVDDHPLALVVDIDSIRTSLGCWDEVEESKVVARRLALTLTRQHLGDGHDVVVPQHLARFDFLSALQDVAREVGAEFVEVLLDVPLEVAVSRFVSRRAELRKGNDPHPEEDVPDHAVEEAVAEAVAQLDALVADHADLIRIEGDGTPEVVHARLVAGLARWAAARTARTVTTDDGTKLWFEQTGSGPAVVLCHGGPGMWDSLGSLASLVEPEATVYRWDQRGCGRSDRVGPFTIEQMVKDLDSIRADRGVDRWVVAGHSWGATLALHYAVAHPDRTAAVIGISGTGLADSWVERNRGAYQAERRRRLPPDKRERLDELAAMETRGPETEREFRLLSWMTDVSPGLDARLVLAEDLTAPWAINFDANRELGADARRLAPELRAALPDLDLPVLLVHGENDPRPRAGAAELAELLPDAELVTLPTGHSPWREAPGEVGEVLSDFLTKVFGSDDRLTAQDE